MMVLSGDFGVTFDEWAQFEYGRRVVAYLISGGSDHSSESYRNLFMYGGFLLGFALPLQHRSAG